MKVLLRLLFIGATIMKPPSLERNALFISASNSVYLSANRLPSMAVPSAPLWTS